MRKFLRLLNLKSKCGVSHLSNLSKKFAVETGRKIMNVISSDDIKMSDVHMIFVSYFEKPDCIHRAVLIMIAWMLKQPLM